MEAAHVILWGWFTLAFLGSLLTIHNTKTNSGAILQGIVSGIFLFLLAWGILNA